ncbi:B12-binding domain-containing radical SAM protein [Magnetococcus sp. PR-3]|uniref:B12-binding domain-containing radical SAM protein n=1 Tax=Magnetococcus sp. PR-3 TaxID=3120355 RepID=UPI002FCE4C7F
MAFTPSLFRPAAYPKREHQELNMKVGILEVLNLTTPTWKEKLYHSMISKQLASVMPQAIAVWCRELGHQTYYKTYYGIGKIENAFPDDLDIIFISSSTIYSPIAYALGKLFRKAGIRTVFGGPHAKSYPADCLRFFDLVVKECNKSLIAEILRGEIQSGQYISSSKPLGEVPTIEERAPEIRASAYFFNKWRSLITVIPTLTSTGCPYTCDFCADWDQPYKALPLDRFEKDIAYLADHFKGGVLSFWEPNFAVKFERLYKVMSTVPPALRVPYMFEASQGILTPSRLEKMQETNHGYLLVGVESWSADLKKGGFQRGSSPQEKFDQTIKFFNGIQKYQLTMITSFIFGLDHDSGDEPVERIKEFIRQVPFTWALVNLPSPYGGTPLFDRMHEENRILNEMPFSFYRPPYLMMRIKNYSPRDYYMKLFEISTVNSSDEALARRMESIPKWNQRMFYRLLTMVESQVSSFYRDMVERLESDSSFRRFHEGKEEPLPEFYHQEYEKHVGRFAPLLSRADRRPNLEQIKPVSI